MCDVNVLTMYVVLSVCNVMLLKSYRVLSLRRVFLLQTTVCLVKLQCFCVKSIAILSARSVDISKSSYILPTCGFVICERYVNPVFRNLKLSELTG